MNGGRNMLKKIKETESQNNSMKKFIPEPFKNAED